MAIWAYGALPWMNASWASLGGKLTSAPAAAGLTVYARGLDNQLWRTSFSGGLPVPGGIRYGHWGPWEPLGGILASAPGAGPDYIGDYFVRGRDNQLWHGWPVQAPDGTTTSTWEPLSGILTSAPAAT